MTSVRAYRTRSTMWLRISSLTSTLLAMGCGAPGVGGDTFESLRRVPGKLHAQRTAIERNDACRRHDHFPRNVPRSRRRPTVQVELLGQREGEGRQPAGPGAGGGGEYGDGGVCGDARAGSVRDSDCDAVSRACSLHTDV